MKLGCVQPGEAVATFGDALRRLTDAATYLYVDGRRYWYSTLPTVTRLADGRAGQISGDQVSEEIVRRLRKQAGTRADFSKVHACLSSGDVTDDREARLVILGPDFPHTNRDDKSPSPRSGSDPGLARQVASQLQERAGISRRGCQPAERIGAGGPAIPGLVVDLGRPGDAEPGPVPNPPDRDEAQEC